MGRHTIFFSVSAAVLAAAVACGDSPTQPTTSHARASFAPAPGPDPPPAPDVPDPSGPPPRQGPTAPPPPTPPPPTSPPAAPPAAVERWEATITTAHWFAEAPIPATFDVIIEGETVRFGPLVGAILVRDERSVVARPANMTLQIMFDIETWILSGPAGTAMGTISVIGDR